MSVLKLSRSENHYAKRNKKEWGENFQIGAGGKMFEGKGKGRAGGSSKSWVSGLKMPSMSKGGSAKTSSKGKAAH